MTTEHEASRTLVKSPPELWAECSEASSLARHLNEFGEIKITRLEPETAVAWEGENASGTVRIEPSGWGTKVTLTAQMEAREVVEPEPVTEREPVAEPEPVAAVKEPEPEPPKLHPEPEREPVSGSTLLARAGFFARMRMRLKSEPVAPPPPPRPEPIAVEPEPERAPEPERVTEPQVDADEILVAALESLGQAHHRPFSRA